MDSRNNFGENSGSQSLPAWWTMCSGRRQGRWLKGTGMENIDKCDIFGYLVKQLYMCLQTQLQIKLFDIYLGQVQTIGTFQHFVFHVGRLSFLQYFLLKALLRRLKVSLLD